MAMKPSPPTKGALPLRLHGQGYRDGTEGGPGGSPARPGHIAAPTEKRTTKPIYPGARVSYVRVTPGKGGR
jgi:hypothetical protein